MKKIYTPINFVLALIITLGVSVSLQSLLAAWSTPTQDAPGGAYPMAVNIGTSSDSMQSIIGSLAIGSSLAVSGVSSFVGNIGIGTTTPNNLIQVKDLINFDNSKSSTYLGYQTGKSITTGYYNTAIGYLSLYSNTIGRNNIAVGYQSLYSNVSGNYNIGIGNEVLYTNSTGTGNIAIGDWAMDSNVSGMRNIALGFYALDSNSSGNNNIALGFLSGMSITTGSNNITIGSSADVPVGTASYQLNIGNTIYGDLSLKKIGINTSAPAYNLDVNGSGGFTSLYVGGSNVKGVAVYQTPSGVFTTVQQGTPYQSASFQAYVAYTSMYCDSNDYHWITCYEDCNHAQLLGGDYWNECDELEQTCVYSTAQSCMGGPGSTPIGYLVAP